MKRPIVITLLVVALLFVLAGIGAVVFFAIEVPEFGFVQPVEFATAEESKTLKVDTEKPLTLKVIDDAGDVTITGADVDTVQVKIVKTAYDSTQARADEEVKGIKYTIEQTGSAIILKYELPKSMNFSNTTNTVDFIVTVPNEIGVDIDTNFGDVNVSDIKGNVVIAHDFGNVTVESIEGALSVDSNSAEITATSVKAGSGDLNLHTDFGSITLEKVSAKNITAQLNSGAIKLSEVRATGDLTTNTDYGDTAFENGSADSLHIETNSGRVSLIKIKVAKEVFVKDDFGDIELEQAFAASYDLHANSGAITVDGAKGKLKAYSDFGNITVSNAQAVTLIIETNSGTVEFSGSLGVGPHFIKSDFGGIDITLPTDSKLNVDLKAGLGFGEINSDIPITVTLNESSNSDKDQITGSINGGGEQLTVQASNGNIDIKVSGK